MKPSDLLPYAQDAVAHLNAISPALPWSLLTFAVFLSIYGVRRFSPRSWLWIEAKLGDNNVVLGLPAALMGAVVSATANGGDIGQAWKGFLAGALAPLLHHALKSYNGADVALDAAQAKFLNPKTSVAADVKAAAVAAVASTLTQQIPVAAPVAAPGATLPSVPSAAPAPVPAPAPTAVTLAVLADLAPAAATGATGP